MHNEIIDFIELRLNNIRGEKRKVEEELYRYIAKIDAYCEIKSHIADIKNKEIQGKTNNTTF